MRAHIPTVGIVVAATITGSLLTVAGVTIAPTTPVPTVGSRDAGWAACVETTYNMGGGGDADLARCDRLYGPTSTEVRCEFNAGEGGQYIAWRDDMTARCWPEGTDPNA